MKEYFVRYYSENYYGKKLSTHRYFMAKNLKQATKIASEYLYSFSDEYNMKLHFVRKMNY